MRTNIPTSIAQFKASLLLACLAVLLGAPLLAQKPLTLENRVRAQAAIERVYYNHRIWPGENPGPKPPFEKMMARDVIEAKVEDYLKKSAALDKFWQRPITAEQLQAEMDRMAKQTKDPETLKELFAALNNDPYLIAECLARPILADRLIRNWYAYDTRFHGDLKREAEALREQLTPENFPYLDAGRFHAVKIELEEPSSQLSERSPDSTVLRLAAGDFEKAVSEYPEVGRISRVEETAEACIIRWNERKTETSLEGGVIVFEKTPFDKWFNEAEHNLPAEVSTTQAGYSVSPMMLAAPITDPTSPDSWKSLWYIPEPRCAHSAVWTGSEMVVWGGYYSAGGSYYLSSGGRYSPSTDTWSATSIDTGCPAARGYHTATWSGTEMIIWGGYQNTSPNYLNTGGRYAPASDTWIATYTGVNCPSARCSHTAVWTGTEMIIWGGQGSSPTYKNDGGRYSPFTNTWSPTSTGTNCPSARAYHTALWRGSRMIVWGGCDYSGYLNTGGKYAPGSDTWLATSTGTNCPSARAYHTALWTGTEMIIWGGSADGTLLNTGARYSPVPDTWTPISTGTNCPSGRKSHTAVWTDAEMIIWGGYDGSDSLNSGGRYNPTSNTWSNISTETNCPYGRSSHTAVWTGLEMLVWGGLYMYLGTSYYFNTGGRYAPSSDTWTIISNGSYHPSGRRAPTGVWTGIEYIIWGGDGAGNTGGRYLPSTDTWMGTSIGANCPSSRVYHTAVWTGTEMVIWGGWGSSPAYKNDGGRYSPSSDTWDPISTAINCPSGRSWHTAVWTGMEMVIWGGYGSSPTYKNDGGRYTPSSDAWTATSIDANCPSARDQHIAIYTGIEMIVWGGYMYDGTNIYYYNSGGRYDLSTDTWMATSTGSNCPSARTFHTAIWTGTEMVIWGGRYFDSYLSSGGRYVPSSDTWTASTTDVNVPSGRYQHSCVWTGTEMIIWGGYSGILGLLNTGGRYTPSLDTWIPTGTDINCPSRRYWHSAIWTGDEMIIWGGSIMSGGNTYPTTGGILYPNTPPRSLPALNTSIGGDAIFTLAAGETLGLDGSASTDGANPYTTTPYHDKLDSIVSYEWDLNGDAAYDTNCSGSTSGMDTWGDTPAALSESDLASLGITSPGVYPVWLRVTDEVGVRACAQVQLTVISTSIGPGEASRQSIPAHAMLASWNKGAGQIHVTYTAACNSLSHAAYWGNLSQISTYAWSGSQCASGAGNIDFTPPVEDIFFVVVGNNGTNEGSYGKDSLNNQRPEATGIGACDYLQLLSPSCDP